MHLCKYLIILLIALFPATLIAQDITGLWKGTMYNDTTQKYYRYEIGISEENGKLSGFSHTFFMDSTGKEYYGLKKVKISIVSDGKIIVEDAGLIANNYPVQPDKGVRQLNVLDLVIKDSIMTLSGPYSTNRTKKFRSLTGTINLQRKNDFWQSALVPHLQELGLSKELSFVKKEDDRIKEEEAKKNAEKDIAINKATAEAKKQTVTDNAGEPLKPAQKPVQSTEKTTQKNEPVKKETAITKSSSAKEDVAKNTNVPEKTSSTGSIVKDKAPQQAEPTKNETGIVKSSSAKETAKVDESKTEEVKEPELKKAGKQTISKETIAKTEIKEIKAPVKNNAPAAEVDRRLTVLQQTVYFSSDSLQLSLYDNGEVDGDTVSVLMNGKVIMPKKGLSTNAVMQTIYADPSLDSVELVMYAENLGSIPPNTGLLVVHDGKSIYEIRFSGDLQKNASIILRRRKK